MCTTFLGNLSIYSGRIKKSSQEIDYDYIYFSWSGQQCQFMSKVNEDIVTILLEIQASGVRFTRLDGALDDNQPIFKLTTLANKADKREFRSRTSTKKVIRSDGITVYIGSSDSGFSIRFYDKAIEQLNKLGILSNTKDYIPTWQRYEIELRNEHCKEFLKDLNTYKDFGLVVKSWIVSKVTFLTPSKKDKDKKRWSTWRDWERFAKETVLYQKR